MKRILNAFRYSWAGLTSCYKKEPAFRQEVWIFCLMVPAAFILGESKVEIVLLIGTPTLVLIAELLNSAVENVNDRIGTQYHELSKLAKDQSSGAVFLSILLTIFVWIYIGIF